MFTSCCSVALVTSLTYGDSSLYKWSVILPPPGASEEMRDPKNAVALKDTTKQNRLHYQPLPKKPKQVQVDRPRETSGNRA